MWEHRAATTISYSLSSCYLIPFLISHLKKATCHEISSVNSQSLSRHHTFSCFWHEMQFCTRYGLFTLHGTGKGSKRSYARTGQGQGTGTDGFHFTTGSRTWKRHFHIITYLFPVPLTAAARSTPSPFPVLVPVPVLCSVNKSLKVLAATRNFWNWERCGMCLCKTKDICYLCEMCILLPTCRALWCFQV